LRVSLSRKVRDELAAELAYITKLIPTTANNVSSASTTSMMIPRRACKVKTERVRTIVRAPLASAHLRGDLDPSRGNVLPPDLDFQLPFHLADALRPQPGCYEEAVR